MVIKYITTYPFNGAESFLRSCQSLTYPRTSQYFMEPEGSLSCSQEPSTGPNTHNFENECPSLTLCNWDINWLHEKNMADLVFNIERTVSRPTICDSHEIMIILSRFRDDHRRGLDTLQFTVTHVHTHALVFCLLEPPIVVAWYRTLLMEILHLPCSCRYCPTNIPQLSSCQLPALNW
jgi:hypothetical protein